MTKVVMIQSVSGNNGFTPYSYGASNVYDLPDTTATDYINKKWAIAYAGWETNSLRPPMVFYPNS